jgi:hypothetical protein
MSTPSSPTLISPSNQANVVGNVLEFVFTIPTDNDSDLLVFMIELDTLNPPNISNTNYKANESRLSLDKKTNGKWEMKDGSGNYIDMPTGGVSSDYYGRDARVTLRQQDTSNYPNLLTNWYWRIKCSDQMINPPVYNRVIFSQCVFGN